MQVLECKPFGATGQQDSDVLDEDVRVLVGGMAVPVSLQQCVADWPERRGCFRFNDALTSSVQQVSAQKLVVGGDGVLQVRLRHRVREGLPVRGNEVPLKVLAFDRRRRVRQRFDVLSTVEEELF